MSTVSTTFTAEPGSLFTALDKIEGRIGGISNKLAGLATSFAKVAAPLAGLAASIGGVVGVVEGVKKAISDGGDLNQLSTQTGATVQDLRTLQFAFTEAGLGAESTGQLISKLQLSLSDVASGGAESAKAFAQLKIDYQQFAKLGAVEQFQAVAKGIQQLASASEKVDVARTLFGQNGSQLLGLLNDSDALDNARKNASNNTTDILVRDAALFERISNLYERIAKVPSTFSTGIADKVAPAILPTLEKIAAMDFSALGQRIGGLLSTFIEAFKHGELGDFVGASLELGFAKALNFFVGAFQTGIQGIGAMMVDVFGNAKFYSGLAKALLGVAGQFGAALLKAFETPLAYMQAAIEHLFSSDGVGLRQKAFFEARDEVLANDPRFKGKTITDLTGITGWIGRSAAEDERLAQFDKAVAAREADLLKQLGYVSVSERAKRIMETGGTRFGFGTMTMNAEEIASAGQGITREGVGELTSTFKALMGDLKLVGSQFKMGTLIDTNPLQERFNVLMAKFALPDQTPGKPPKPGLGATEIITAPIADSLAKIGGGGNYRAFSPELSETQKQTAAIEKQTSVMEKVHTTLTEIKTGMAGGKSSGPALISGTITS